jgi:hypothetical protein
MKTLANILVLLCSLFFSTISFNVISQTSNSDLLVRQALQEMLAKGNVNKVEELIEKASNESPNFRLANFLKAEFYSAMSGMEVAKRDRTTVRDSEIPHNLIEEAKLRISVPKNVAELKPLQILKLPDTLNYIILVDASISRAYLLRNKNGEPVWENDFFITVGQYGVGKDKEGDLKTPLGLYTIGDEVPKKNLTPFYGLGALKLNFPSAYDKFQQKSGSGIWLHGVPAEVYNRPAKASEGCIVFTNPDIKYLLKLAKVNRINVLVSPSVKWLYPKDWRATYNRVMNDLSDTVIPENNPNHVDFQRLELSGIYLTENDKTLILDRALKGSSVVRREYWTKNADDWQLKFKVKTKDS